MVRDQEKFGNRCPKELINLHFLSKTIKLQMPEG